MERTINRIALATAAVVIAALATATLYPQFAQTEDTSHTRTTPEHKAWIQRLAPLLDQGNKAMEKGDYAAAETAFQSAVDQDPEDHSLSMNLARLYDLQGRDREALAAYKRVIAPYNGESSHQTDPRVLARYGDLLLKFGEEENASAAYLAAAQAGERTPPDSKLATLRSVAHTAAGEKGLFQSDAQGAVRELELALVASPDSWEAHYYLGVAKSRLGDRQGALAAFAAAEKTAPAEELRKLRRRRSSLGIGKNDTVSVIEIKGKTATLREEPAAAP